MRKSIFTLIFLVSIGISKAQENTLNIKEGTILIIGQPSGARYQHIDFPRKNIIIKRGGIANFNGLIGEKLVVENFTQDKNGATIAILRRKDGLNFFRFYPKISAKLEQALKNKELKHSIRN